ncbi:bifunctional proline dehydrogenase/L-glutamate gamma-semialdehyde dehydrogenase [Desulfatibacillum aliphaticivorans]|uniref:bifunctional proline dehydrogenase/L-glutamate gamma-semialdehyde dehydrogenase n=1 Tax=Desulfatibacillum aliphaticivorans TaxID=218208 RepID=UPI00040368EB|nr:bifunctional proline dehydrogenase/L-glutamate gamma-semialdehyde dehydrogenase [Desulfatibacillum aliphaticivorans]
MADMDDRKIRQAAAELAAQWQDRANKLLTREEKAIQEQMLKLLTHPSDKVVLTKMIDQCFRSHDNDRVADQVNHLLTDFGVPGFFSRVEKLLIQMFMGLGRHFPDVAVPRMVKQMRQSSSRAIIPGEVEPLHKHLEKRKNQGVRMNINHLGEAVLGEEEAHHRLVTYIQDMADPDVEYISVKISTLYSQISSLAFEHTVDVMVDRLSKLYAVAKQNTFTRRDGTKVPKVVHLDMEEYRDLHITYQAFIRTLDKPEFKDYSAGIVLQAYIPDSHPIQQQLTEWAKKRVAGGGAPVNLRIVKGANMEMEMIESHHFNWPLAPYDNKLDVDANYKRMVRYAMQPENIKAVRLGVASHNLFELAYAHETGKALGVAGQYWFEMLEGMADHVRRAICEMSGEVLLYAPVATNDQFINAIAYLIRRLDENTSPENFLRYSPALKTDSEAWDFLKDSFLESCDRIDTAPFGPKRSMDRATEKFPEDVGAYHSLMFTNEADTDWSLLANVDWAKSIRDKWMMDEGAEPAQVPIVVAGEEIFDRDPREAIDSARYDEKTGQRIVVANYAMATAEDADKAVETAKADPDGWRSKSLDERHAILDKVAHELRKARGDLIGAAAANTGKVFTEADPEVSEAVDFVEFYPHSAKLFENLPNIKATPKGVGLVVTPWNFPIAIPCGGMASALAAGNTVIFKPASAAVVTAWELVQCFYRAGVSKNALQFLPCSGGEVGPRLVNNPDVDFVILTGGTDTGMEMLKQRPDMFLAAETGGKNATIVTAMSDRDQAIKNILHSAFSNCGQKCSATSLVILEKEVYEDELFRKQLADAAKSFKVGSCWKFRNKMGPLIHPPKGDLKKALTTLEPGESWVLQPEQVGNNPYLWTPGIKWGVKPGSYTHMTEFFGPLIGVMEAKDLNHAMELVNQTGYGLTSGLESLDHREQLKWKDGIKAGNLYINKGTTGAIVLRQPFGGMRKSALGAGIKAGSPNYVYQFMDFEDVSWPEAGPVNKETALLRIAQDWEIDLKWNRFPKEVSQDLWKTVRAIKSYVYQYDKEFGREHDYFTLRGQDNLFRYLPKGRVVIRVTPQDSLFETLARVSAAIATRCVPMLSLPPGLDNELTAFLATRRGQKFCKDVAMAKQTDKDLCAFMPKVQRIRYAGPDRVPMEVFEEAAKTGFYISRTPVSMEGRIELLQYIQEQSISVNYHRYGNLGARAVD